MKLVSLLEDDTQDLNPEETPEIQTYNRIIEMINKLKEDFGFYTKDFIYPEGKFEMRMWTKLEPGQHLSDTYGDISLGMYFMPYMDDPSLPSDIVRRPLDLFIKTIKDKLPEVMENPDLYPREALNKVEIKIADFYIRFGRALYNFNELIPRTEYNTKVRGFSEHLGDMLYDPSITEQCMFQENQLPQFDPHFKSIHDNVIKRTALIVKSLRKGKWNGHTYDIGLIDNVHNTILLLDDHKEPIVNDGVIRPLLIPHLSMSSPIIDGKSRWANADEFPLTDDELTEFRKHMDKVFAKFKIKYS